MAVSSVYTDILVSLLIGLACYSTLRFYRRGNIRLALVSIVAIGALFRLYTGMDGYLHVWDERYHALVARNMISDPFRPALYDNPLLPYDFRAWCCNHIWLNKPPLPFWLMSGSMSLFGVHLWALRLPSFLLSLCAIYLTFRIGALLFSKKTGLIAAFLYAVNGKLIELAAGCDSSDHIETCHVVLFEVAVYGIIRYWEKPTVPRAAFIGLFTGLTFLSKWTPAVFIPAIWLIGSVWQKTKLSRLIAGGLTLGLVAAAVALPWAWHIAHAFSRESREIFTIMSTANKRVIEGHTGEWYFYLDRARIIFGEIVYLPMIAGLWRISRKKRFTGLSLIFVWIALPMLLFSTAATKRDTYLMILAPAFFLLIAYWVRVLRIRFRRPWGIVLAVLLLLLPLRYGVERSKLFMGRLRAPEWMTDVQKIRRALPGPPEKTVVFGFDHHLELMFHTGVTAYPQRPDDATVQQLKQEGYAVWYYAGGSLQEY